MKKIAVAIAISLIVGFATASWMDATLVPAESMASGPGESSAASFDGDAPVEERIRELERLVMEEREARQWLEEEVFMLREEVEQQRTGRGAAEERAASIQQDSGESYRRQRFAGNATQHQITRLVEAGFPASRAEWIVQREAALLMEQLQARYEARRGEEGSRFFGSGISTDGVLRTELGDTDFERYLAANGRSTSVGIGNVIPNSPAQEAGLQQGDQIVRYDGERVFSMMDMAERIMQNRAEGNVVVDIERGGIPMQLVIPRGPLGVMGN